MRESYVNFLFAWIPELPKRKKEMTRTWPEMSWAHSLVNDFGIVKKKRDAMPCTLPQTLCLFFFSFLVSVGTAKYEPENGAIVWRIDDFPKAHDAQASFSCHLELTDEMTHPDFSLLTAVLRYAVSGSCVSGARVWSLRVPTTSLKPPEKNVAYSTRFRYHVAMQPGRYELAMDDD